MADEADRGQALIEFALTLPVLLVMVIGVLFVSEIGLARLALEHAAAEGARTAALTNDDDLVRRTVAASVTPLDASKVRVSIDPPQSRAPRNSEARGSLVRVDLRYAIPIPLALVGLSRFVVEGQATRRIEWSP